VDVADLIARRLGAQQILNANPNDSAAQQVLANCDAKLKKWSDQKKALNPGKFTGEASGINRMKEKEMHTAIEHWVRKDFFQTLEPLKEDNLGMKMLQKMGWTHGKPLGKKGEGYIAPIQVDIRVGRMGLMGEEEERNYNEHQRAMHVPRGRGRVPIVMSTENILCPRLARLFLNRAMVSQSTRW